MNEIDNRCVCCGEIIPEGRQVCPICENKVIEEMAKVIKTTEQIARDAHCGLPSPTMYAKDLYWKGYRKQSVGEWVNGVNGSKVCSMCGKEPLYTASGTSFATTFYKAKSNFCPNCGAKMKGGAE
jgi:RNA polymerase subunit RPABC4/transcription elongation factor Spt4